MNLPNFFAELKRRNVYKVAIPTGETIWIADAHRGDGKRYVVRADEKLTAFVELEAVTHKESPITESQNCRSRVSQ